MLLRLCNELLRRLSKTCREHAVLGGRILLLLSSTFAINERSGVNLKGDFDTSLGDIHMDEVIECDPPSSNTPEAIAEHPQFYVLFWSLQRYFANPALLLQATDAVPGATVLHALKLLDTGSPSTMQAFQAGVQCVLDVFRWINKKTDFPPKTRCTSITEAELMSAYPQYLSSYTLFSFEMYNMAFQRQFLLQCLITFQYLLGQTSTSQEHTKDWKNKLFVPTHTLSDADEQWTRKTWRFVQTLLRESAQDGKIFLDAVLLLLRRESSWIRWKGAGAPMLHHDAISSDTLQAWNDKIQGAFVVQEPWFPHAVGTPELSRLWEEGLQVTAPSSVEVQDEEGNAKVITTDGWEELEFPRGKPTLQVLLRSMQHSNDADKIQSLKWRALRCVDREHLHLLACMDSLDDISSLLKVMDDEKRDVEFEPDVIGQELVMEEEPEDVEMAPPETEANEALDCAARQERTADVKEGEEEEEDLKEKSSSEAGSKPAETRDGDSMKETQALADQESDTCDERDETARATPSNSQVREALSDAGTPDMLETQDGTQSSVLSSSSSSPLSSSVDGENAEADATFMTAPAHDDHPAEA